MQMVSQSQQQGEVFRHFVCRTAGLPVERLDLLRARRSLAAMQELAELRERLDRERQALTDLLYQAVGATNQRKLRGVLVGLKRDIHNQRLPKDSQLNKIEDSEAAGQVLGPVRRFRDLGREVEAAERDVRQGLEEELLEIRGRFQEQVTESDFQKGLILSSPTLFKQLERYLEAEDFNKKDRQIERSLMRYFSRMVMKATPFGTFCSVTSGTFDRKAEERAGLSGDPTDKTSLVMLNKIIYTDLLIRLLAHPQVRLHFDVELNPTLRREGGKLLFLTALGPREVFQRLPLNPVLQLLEKIFAEGACRPLKDTIQRLSRDPQVEASPEEAEAYLSKLLEIGFLRYRVGIREQEVDWDYPLLERLQGLEGRAARRARRLLREMRSAAQAFAAAGVEERRKLIDRTRRGVDEALQAIDEELDEESRKRRIPMARTPIALRTKIPFYEDAGASTALAIHPDSAEDVLRVLEEYVGWLSRLAEPRQSQAGMRHFFEQQYGQESAGVPLLQFYEDFYREHFKVFLEESERRRKQGPNAFAAGGHKDQQGHTGQQPRDAAHADAPQTGQDPSRMDLSNPFKLESISKMHEANAALRRLVEKRWQEDPQAAEIRLQSEDFREVLGEIPEPPRRPRSMSMFAQYIPNLSEEGDGLVTNTFLTGYGKYFSRFLVLFPDQVESDVLEENCSLGEDLLAEICGDAGFNANLHPPLLPYEISYPTSESGPARMQLRVADLKVGPAPDDPQELELLHEPSGKRVLPVDLGFMNPRMRPPLFQLLSRFTPPSAFSFPIPETPADSLAPGGDAQEEAVRQQAGQGKNGQHQQHATGKKGDDGAGSQDGSEGAPATGLAYRPRITYRGRLVLARRHWVLRPESFPQRQTAESDEGYFFRVNGWRRQLGLPETVFMRVHPKPLPPHLQEQEKEKAQQGASQARIREHLYKPQFIDFGNPLLVDLFSRATENLPYFHVALEERLPDDAHLLRDSQGRRFASELILQLNFPAR